MAIWLILGDMEDIITSDPEDPEWRDTEFQHMRSNGIVIWAVSGHRDKNEPQK